MLQSQFSKQYCSQNLDMDKHVQMTDFINQIERVLSVLIWMLIFHSQSLIILW
jgi:hypothetical protein